METEESQTQRYVIIAILAFLVGFGSAWLWLDRGISNDIQSGQLEGDATSTPTLGENPSGSIDTTNNIVTTGGDSVTVSDQKAGTEVVLSGVSFEKGGWVAIHEDDNGKLGKILGVQLFDAGKGVGIVELLRGTLPGNTYYAVLHNDNGDRAFDPKIDLPIIGTNNSLIMTTFKAQ